VFYWDSYNYHGVFEYLWSTSGSTWTAYDAFTQEYLYTMEDVPSGTTIYGPKGEIYRINVDTRNGLMTLWNSSRVVSSEGSWGSSANTQRTFDATRGIEWAKTIPTDLPGSAYQYKLDDRVVGVDYSTLEVTIWGLSLKPGQEGTLLFKKTWKAPADWEEGQQSISRGAGSIDDGLITIWSKETQQNWGFSTETGEYLWGPTEPQNYLDFLGNRRFIAYGKFYSQGMSGILYCYDAKTGELLWTYSADDPYNQVLWANDWSIRPVIVTDGKIYMGNSEHSPVDPKPRGGPFVCVNATTGEEIWRADGLFRQTDWGGRAVIGDSIIATMDTYDQRIYAIAKGPSATSVSVQNDVTTHGSSVLVKGMVTDVSPGTQEYALTARFPNGVPAVADENMSDWMLYVYKQFERPADVVGVEVVVEVVDPNTNFYEVGRTTSDADGFFSCAFTPEVPGKYTIIASFAGSKAYYGSHAKTAINVEEAPAATPEPTPVPQAPVETYFAVSTIAIIAAIVIGFALLLLRKR
jgi:outer membrane protein assembly factor BamB